MADLLPFDDDATCGGYRCQNRPTRVIVVNGTGGMLGKMCESCTDDLEREMADSWKRNRELAALETNDD
jgi:hypothetical protein